MNAHRLRLVEDSLQTVNQILMVLVAVKDVESRKDELILVVHKLLEKLNVVRI